MVKIVSVFKNNLTEENLKKIGLNKRQLNAVKYVQNHTQITNHEYQKINDVSKATATRDIQDLIVKEILKNIGTKGSSAIYKLFSVGS